MSAWLHVDSPTHYGVLWAWAANPNGSNHGWRGLVRVFREFTPGFSAELRTWGRAENIRPRAT